MLWVLFFSVWLKVSDGNLRILAAFSDDNYQNMVKTYNKVTTVIDTDEENSRLISADFLSLPKNNTDVVNMICKSLEIHQPDIFLLFSSEHLPLAETLGNRLDIPVVIADYSRIDYKQSGSLLTNLQIDASHLINAVTTLTSFSKWRKLLFLLDDSSKAQNIERLLGGMDVDDTQILLLQRFDLDSAVNFIQRNPCDVLIYCCDPYVLYEMLQREKMKILKQNWILLDEALSRQANLINKFPTGMLGIRQIPLKSNKQTLKATLLMLNEITKSLPKVGFLGNISCWRGSSPKRRRYSEQLKERILQQVNSNLNNRLTFDGGGGRSLQPIFEVLNLVDKKFRFKRNPGKITSRKINKSKFNDAEGSKSYIQAISATQYVDIEETSELLQEFLGSAVYTNSVSIVNELERKKISYEDSKTTENQRLYLVNELDNKEDIDIYMSEIKPNIKPKKLETKKHQFKNESSSIKNFNFIALKDEHNNKQRAPNPNTVTAQTSIEDKSVVSAFNVVKKSKKTPKKLTALGLISHPIVFPVNIVTKIDQTKNVEDSETDSLDPVRIDEMLKKSNKRINDEDKLSYEVEADSNYDDSMKYFTLRYNRSRVEAHKYWKYIGNISSTLNFNVVIWPTGTLSSVARNKAMYKVVTTLLSPFVMEDKSKDKCLSGLECIILPEGIFNVLEDANWNRTKWKTCCYGLSIDLIIKLSNDLGISFQLYLLEGYRSTRTEKLIREIERGVIHLSFAPLNPSSSRSKAIDFSVPYFYSGLSFLANIDNDDVSLLAFLEPFSMDLWIVIFVSLNLTAIVVAVYEWLSPFGLNPYGRQRTKNFSLASALWVMWGLLFSHLVQFKAPKSWPNKFLINVWGGFSVIFLASYTANIAALFAGIFAHGPVTNFGDANLLGQRIGTKSGSAAETYAFKTNRKLWEHMQKFRISSYEEGLEMLRNGSLDMLVGESPALDYLRATDLGCTLQNVGEIANGDAFTIAFTKGLNIKSSLDQIILQYAANGYLDELRNKWYQSLPCYHLSSDTYKPQALGVSSVVGVFILLGFGIAAGFVILILEHFVFSYVLPKLRVSPKSSTWRSTNVMFFSQKLYRFINSVELLPPHHAALELVQSIRRGHITSLFQKSVKRKENEQKRRRRSKAQFFEMIQEIKRFQQEERRLNTVHQGSCDSATTSILNTDLTNFVFESTDTANECVDDQKVWESRAKISTIVETSFEKEVLLENSQTEPSNKPSSESCNNPDDKDSDESDAETLFSYSLVDEATLKRLSKKDLYLLWQAAETDLKSQLNKVKAQKKQLTSTLRCGNEQHF